MIRSTRFLLLVHDSRDAPVPTSASRRISAIRVARRRDPQSCPAVPAMTQICSFQIDGRERFWVCGKSDANKSLVPYHELIVLSP